MADLIRFTCVKPARLIFSSLTVKSKPSTVPNAQEKFSGTFGLDQVDFDAMLPIMVKAITDECGNFSGNPADYYLACMSGRMAASRVRETAKLKAAGKGSDEAFKIMEKAEKRAVLYETFAGVLSASSQYDVELARLEMGVVKDIPDSESARAQAGKDLFYPGAWVVPSIDVKGFRRKTLDAKDGCTSYIKNCLFIAKGPRIETGGGGASNSDIFGGFNGYSDFDPTAMAPSGSPDYSSFTGGAATGGNPPPPPPPATAPPPPPPPTVDPNRPTDAAYRHDNGDGTEQWHANGAWDGLKHPVPSSVPPPPPVAAAGGLPANQPAW